MFGKFLQAMVLVMCSVALVFGADEKKKVGMTIPTTGNAKQVGEISLKAMPAATYAMVKVTAASCEPEGGFKAGDEGYDQAYEAMMTKGFGALLGWINSGNVPVGPAAAFYYEDPSETPVKDLTCSVGFPAAKDAKGSEQVKIEEVAAHDAAVVQYSGDYKESGPIWNALGKWITDNGYEHAGAPMEVYLTGPHDTQNPAEYLTEVRWPVKKAAPKK